MQQVLVINSYFENGRALYVAGQVYEESSITQRMVRRGDARLLPKSDAGVGPQEPGESQAAEHVTEATSENHQEAAMPADMPAEAEDAKPEPARRGRPSKTRGA